MLENPYVSDKRNPVEISCAVLNRITRLDRKSDACSTPALGNGLSASITICRMVYETLSMRTVFTKPNSRRRNNILN